MSRLEEMKDKYLKAIPFETINGINVIAVDKKDLDYFIKQAERVQELEQKVRVDSDLFDKQVQQNKRYREWLERAFKADDLENIWDIEDEYKELESESE